MNQIAELIEKINALGDSLKKDGKQGPGKFFLAVASKLQAAKNIVEVKHVLLDDIEKSGSITSYGGFSANEERLFEEIYALSEKILDPK